MSHSHGEGDRPGPVSAPARYFEELKERRVVRSAALYAAGAFVVLQVADLVIPALTFLPTWTYTAIVVLSIVGFPFAMVLAWVYDVTADGIAPTDGPGRVPHRLGRTATFVLGASLSVMLSAMVTYFDDPSRYAEATERYGEVTAADIAELARRRLNPDGGARVLVVPEAAA